MSEPRLVEDASTQYSDWTGTAAGEPASKAGPSVAEVLRIDTAQWSIIGLELYFGTSASAAAYVLPRGHQAAGQPEIATRMEIRLGEDGAPSLMEVIAGFDRFEVVLKDHYRPHLEFADEMVWDNGTWVPRG